MIIVAKKNIYIVIIVLIITLFLLNGDHNIDIKLRNVDRNIIINRIYFMIQINV